MDSFNNFFKNVKKLFNTSTKIQFKNLDIGRIWDTPSQRDKLEDSKTFKSFDGISHNRNIATPLKRSNKAMDYGVPDRSRNGKLRDAVQDANTTQKNINKGVLSNKNKVVSITYEEIGLFPRSFSRVLDRFLTQLFGDVETLLLQEYRFYRYLFLTTLKTIFLLIFVPLAVNFLSKNYIVRPLTEYFWNAKQTEIFLNSYEQKRAFAELHDFEDKLYFEALMFSHGKHNAYGNIRSEAISQPIPGETVGTLRHDKQANDSAEISHEVSYTIDNLSFMENLVPSKISSDLFSSETKEMSSVRSVPSTITESPMQSSKYSYEVSEVTPLTSIAESRKITKLPESSIRDSVATPSTDTNSGTIGDSIRTTGISMIIKESQSRLQEKTMDLAQKYNKYSIEALTNLFSDLLSFLSLIYLLITLEIQINITKSFLLEVFFSFEDSKKSLLILLITDLLVGYHSSNLWELLFQFVFYHYGIPESQTGVYLLVATLPVLLDVLFKYLIFRHLNRSSPATVATYHAILE